MGGFQIAVVFIVLSALHHTAECYGVDVSFPIHHDQILDQSSVHAVRYRKFMEGCYKEAGEKRSCDSTERARVAMSLDQPKRHINYTETGFKKTRVPETVWQDIIQFWEANKQNEVIETWNHGNTYVNHWESNPGMVSFENKVS